MARGNRCCWLKLAAEDATWAKQVDFGGDENWWLPHHKKKLKVVLPAAKNEVLLFKHHRLCFTSTWTGNGKDEEYVLIMTSWDGGGGDNDVDHGASTFLLLHGS